MFQTEGSKIARKRLKVVQDLRKFKGSRMRQCSFKSVHTNLLSVVYIYSMQRDQMKGHSNSKREICFDGFNLGFQTNGPIYALGMTAQ